MIDKDFTYEVIAEMREYGVQQKGYTKTLLLGAANVMEKNIRAYLDLVEAMLKEQVK